jgi:hypothetical protein
MLTGRPIRKLSLDAIVNLVLMNWAIITGGVSQDREETAFYGWGTTKDDDSPVDKDHDELLKRPESTLSLNTAAGSLPFEGSHNKNSPRSALADPLNLR